MRAVSFFGPGDGPIVGAAAPEAADPRPDAAGATGAGDLGINGGEDAGGEAPPTVVPPEGGAAFFGKNGGGETGLAGAGGKGVWARGGRGAGEAAEVVGGTGVGTFGRADVSLAGGRAGKFIRTVSRALVPVPEGWVPGPGGKLMRTVSFFGSF